MLVFTMPEPDQAYAQWPVSFLAAPYGTVPYNDSRLLIQPEMGPFIITATQINTHIFQLFCSILCVGLRERMEDCSLTQV